MNSLSIIIPVYNADKFLEECILSIINELKETDELIIINDGSKDNSEDICKRYVGGNIHFINNNSNQGVSYSRNCGINYATRDYIAFVDSDDFLLPKWRNTMELGIETEKDIIYFSEDIESIPDKREIIIDALGFPIKKQLSIQSGVCWSKLFRKDYIKNAQIFFDAEIIHGEDGLFSLNAILNTKSYTVIKAPKFYCYRIYSGSASHTFNEKFNDSNLKYIRTLKDILKASELFTEDEVSAFINYSNCQGVFILAYRISLIKDINLRKKKYVLFTKPEYIELFNARGFSRDCSKHLKLVVHLIRVGKYNEAISFILVLTKINLIIMKARGRIGIQK